MVGLASKMFLFTGFFCINLKNSDVFCLLFCLFKFGQELGDFWIQYLWDIVFNQREKV
jgi:hypothetical protein